MTIALPTHRCTHRCAQNENIEEVNQENGVYSDLLEKKIEYIYEKEEDYTVHFLFFSLLLACRK